MQYNEFEIGDIVTVVDRPYRYCPFSWATTMDQYLSSQAVIVDKVISASSGTFGYRIDIDDGDHVWCGNCFQPKFVESEDFECADNNDIAKFFGI